MRIASHIRRKLSVLSLLFVVLTMATCIKVDTPPALEVTILDSFDNTAGQVLVGIFDSQVEWAMGENPIQAWKMTDSNGKVMFANLKEKSYFIYAEKDNLNNLKNEIGTKTGLNINEIRSLLIHID